MGANLVRFVRALRRLGIPAGPARVVGALTAVRDAGLARRDDVRVALRSLVCSRPDQFALFDVAFGVLWRTARGMPPDGGLAYETLPAHVERLRLRRRLEEASRRVPWALAPTVDARGRSARPTPAAGRGTGERATWGTEPDRGRPDALPGDAIDHVRRAAYSPRELLRHKPLGELDPVERAALREFLRRLAMPPRVRSRRCRSARRGARWDVHRSMRRALRAGGEMVELRFLRPRPRPVRLVLLCDVSGSMEDLARPLVSAAHALARRWGDVETFVFGTRLSRITPQLRRSQVDRALEAAFARVVDWAGGTRIGESLAMFNRRYARRALGRGALVLIVSDGWDRGDPQVLGREMRRLQGWARRVIWIDPAIDTQEARDEAGGLPWGMEAALPYVDEWVPGVHVRDLEALARWLSRLDGRRPVRPRVPAAGRPGSRHRGR